MKKTITTLVVAGAVGSAAILAGAYSGLINVGADDPHYPAVHAFLSMARDRSIEARSKDIEIPNLDDEALIRGGAGNYNAMCVGCHLAPGVEQTELSQALYPAPPNLAKIGIDAGPASAFWVIKHGIKATGMPAWGKSMGDEYIWGMVAFISQLPKIDATQYQALVAASGGHQHGGGESQTHNHESLDGSNSDHHGNAAAGGESGRRGIAAADHHGGSASESDQHSASSNGDDHHDGSNSSSKGSSATDDHAEPSSNTHTHTDGKVHVHGS